MLFVTHDVDEALYLADRIIVMSPKPSRVVETVTVAAPRPRAIETDPGLRAMRRDLLETFDVMEKNKEVEVSS